VFLIYTEKDTIKPTHAVTSIKQLPVLKGRLFLVLSWEIDMNLTSFKRSPVLKDHFFFFPNVTS